MMSMLYQTYQNHVDLTEPWRTGAASALRYLNLVPQGVPDRFAELIKKLDAPGGAPQVEADGGSNDNNNGRD